MIKGKLFIRTLLLLFVIASCNNDDFDKYERPDWLAGKVFTLLKGEDNLQTFAKCIELTGYDKIIDVSGSYTVFAPTDEAFSQFFSSNPAYSSVDDIPLEVLDKIVKYHILQNPWDRKQLRSLDVHGWIDPEDEFNDKPRGFKRETLLLNDDEKYGVRRIDNQRINLRIVDTTQTTWHRRVITDSRKYAPLFYQEYFGIYELQFSDYSFYFDRDFENSEDIYFVNAKLLGEEIFAENGFIHKIDRVVEPLKNANELLRANDNYSTFVDWINYFPELTWNERLTYMQPGADQGLEVDSLFDLNYPQLTFNIAAERTRAPAGGAGMPSEVTIRFHHGIIAPTNQALAQFEETYLRGSGQWGSFREAPHRIRRIIVNSYLSVNPIFPSDMYKGFFNGERDVVKLSESDIAEKQFGSNSTFIGVDQPIVPRAFSSITGPIYRQRGFSTVMNAIESSGLLSAMKRIDQEMVLFVMNDQSLQADSSLLYINVEVNNVMMEFFRAYTLYPSIQMVQFNQNDLRLLLLNHVAVEKPRGQARKEFLKTLAGNYLIWNNETGIVSGTNPSAFGFKGTDPVDNRPRKISENTDNGDTYQIDGWFSFSASNRYDRMERNFPDFNKLIDKAGLARPREGRYTIAPDNQIFTIFAPSKEALEEIGADTLTGPRLLDFVRMHFIQGELIFTDGKMHAGYYRTANVSYNGVPLPERSIYIEPGIDAIRIKAKNGGNYYTVEESDKTNFLSAINLDQDQTNFLNIMTTGVIHGVDKAFSPGLLDVR